MNLVYALTYLAILAPIAFLSLFIAFTAALR